jgi:signal recognition particle subunit SEC65
MKPKAEQIISKARELGYEVTKEHEKQLNRIISRFSDDEWDKLDCFYFHNEPFVGINFANPDLK